VVFGGSYTDCTISPFKPMECSVSHLRLAVGVCCGLNMSQPAPSVAPTAAMVFKVAVVRRWGWGGVGGGGTCVLRWAQVFFTATLS